MMHLNQNLKVSEFLNFMYSRLYKDNNIINHNNACTIMV